MLIGLDETSAWECGGGVTGGLGDAEGAKSGAGGIDGIVNAGYTV